MSDWPEAKVEELRRWADGKRSAATIAKIMSSSLGEPITKNAVIGQCYRRGFPLPPRTRGIRLGSPTPAPKPINRREPLRFTPPMMPPQEDWERKLREPWKNRRRT
jgi:hypothetical protein